MIVQSLIDDAILEISYFKCQHRDYIFQNTIITVYEVESQKTVTTKLGKRTNWFSEVIKELYQNFPEKKAGRHQKTESKIALHC